MKNKTILICVFLISSCDATKGVLMDNQSQPYSANRQIAQFKLELFPPGSPVVFGDYIVMTSQCVDNLKSKNEYEEVDKDKKITAIEVMYKNPTSDRVITYNSFQWKLVDNRGYSFEMMMGGSKSPKLGSGSLNPGQFARGWINFSPQSDSEGFTVKFEKELAGQSISFSCGI